MPKTTDSNVVPEDVPASLPECPEEGFLRVTDRTILNFIKNLEYREQKFHAIMSTQMRAFGQAKDIERSSTQRTPLKLPSVTVKRGDWAVDLTRFVRAQVRARFAGKMTDANRIFRDNTRKIRLVANWPNPYDVNYEIEIWTKTRQDANAMLSIILSHFDPNPDLMYLKGDFGAVWGEKLIPFYFEGVNDASDTEAGDVDKVEKHIISLRAATWMFKTPEEIPSVGTTTIGYFELDCEGEPFQLLETQVIPASGG